MYICINIWAAIAIMSALACVLVWSDYKESKRGEVDTDCDCDD